MVQTALRVGASESRAGAERIALSSRVLLPLLAAQGSGLAGMTELARDLRAQIAARGERGLALVLPAGAAHESQPARIDLGGRQIAIPAALRDALLARLGTPETAPGLARTAVVEDSATRAWATGASAQVAAQTAMPSAAHLAAQSALTASIGGIARELLRSVAPATAVGAREGNAPRVDLSRSALGEPAGSAPVGPVLPVAEVASQLRREVERSGLFFEAHLAQWARGERSVDELRAELLHLAADASIAPGKSGAQAIADSAPQRVAGQLRLLQEPCIAISGAAWPGQPMLMLIEREPPPRDAAPGMPPVFGAHLRLALPRLGNVEVHLRLAGEAVCTTICAQDPDRLQAGLPALGDQLRATGLTPVSTHVLAVESEST